MAISFAVALVLVIAQIRLALRLVRAKRALRSASTLIAASIVMLAFASLAILLSLPAISGDLAIRHQLASLAAPQRSVTVVISPERRPEPAEKKQFDATVRRQLSVPGYGSPTRVSYFRSLASPTGAVFRLVGTEKIRSALRLTSGRWPTMCTPERCEVVSVGKASVARSGRGEGTVDLPDVKYLRVVGRATPGPDFPFAGPLAPSNGELLVVADGPDDVQNIKTLDLIRRIDGWVAPIVASKVGRDSVGTLLRSAGEITEKIDISGVSVTVPDDELQDALDRSRTAGATVATSGAALLCLLIVACAAGGFSAKGNHMLAYERLRRRGANEALLRSYRFFAAAIIVAIGLVAGLAIGAIAIALIAELSRVSVSQAFEETTRATSLVTILGAAVLLLGVLLLAMNDRADRPTLRFGRIRLSDVIAVPVVAFTYWAVVRFRSGGPDSPPTSAWPSLVLIAGVLVWVAVRVLPFVIRMAIAHRAGGNPVFAMVGTKSPARQKASLAGGALASVAAAMSMFAVSSGATLATNTADQARFAVPLDYRLRIGSSLVRPDELRRSARWQNLRSSLREDLADTDVVRRGATLLGESGDGSLEVVGVAPDVVGSAATWRRDYGPRPAALRRLLLAPKPVPLGTPIGKTGTHIYVDVSGDRTALDIAAVFERSNGTWHELGLEEVASSPPTRAILRGELDADDIGGRFLGFRVGVNAFFAEQIEHKIGEGNTFTDASNASVQIHAAFVGPNTFDIGSDADRFRAAMPSLRRVAISAASLRSDRAVLRAGADDTLDVRVSLQGTSALLLPDDDTDAIPALVDDATAKSAGGVGSTFFVETLQRRIPFRVVATAKRFPTAGERFVIADVHQVARQFNLAQPGFGTPTEAWVGMRRGARDSEAAASTLSQAMRSSPIDQLIVEDRSAIAQRLESDPFRRSSALLLRSSLAIALLVAAVGLFLSSRSDVVDQELFRRTPLLDGVSHRTLASAFARRAYVAVACAVPLGIVTGLPLLRVGANSIVAGASNEVDILPLRLVVPGGPVALVGIVMVSVFCLASLGGARSVPDLATEDLMRGRL